MNEEYILNIVQDFENCGENGKCSDCKANEKINGTDCKFCNLLLIYRNDISNGVSHLIDKM